MAFPLHTEKDVANALNDRVRIIETTLRGGNRSTTNVVLALRWEVVNDEIFLADYDMYRPSGGVVHVSGAYFATDDKRASCLPFLHPRDLLYMISERLKKLDGLDRLHKYVVVEKSSDGLLVQRVSIPLVRAA